LRYSHEWVCKKAIFVVTSRQICYWKMSKTIVWLFPIYFFFFIFFFFFFVFFFFFNEFVLVFSVLLFRIVFFRCFTIWSPAWVLIKCSIFDSLVVLYPDPSIRISIFSLAFLFKFAAEFLCIKRVLKASLNGVSLYITSRTTFISERTTSLPIAFAPFDKRAKTRQKRPPRKLPIPWPRWFDVSIYTHSMPLCRLPLYWTSKYSSYYAISFNLIF